MGFSSKEPAIWGMGLTTWNNHVRLNWMESKRNGGGTDSSTCPSGMLERESERVYRMNVRLNADNMLKVLISLHTDCHGST